MNNPGTPSARYTLKHDGTFLVADELGDITGERDGLFCAVTRFLSRFVLLVGGVAPSLLSSGVSQDNVIFRANLTNRPLPELGGTRTPEGVIHIERTRLLWDSRLFERITLTNYGESGALLPLQFAFASDFADIFEVRGYRRSQPGTLLPATQEAVSVAQAYRGRDGVVRICVVAFSHQPARLTTHAAEFALELPPRGHLQMQIEVGIEPAAAPDARRFRHAAAMARRAMRQRRRIGASLHCVPGPFRTWLDKSRADLAQLTTGLDTGPYPFAGIPWFSTPFGRDGIITALQLLWLDPSLARGVLGFLAATQAQQTSDFDDSAPGKILHETRGGELAAVGEVPFRRYYGGVDTTPLFLLLAGAYAQRTGDFKFVDTIWPALERAMAWIEASAATNSDGFVTYARARSTGLVNQGWKDSSDSIFHADGTMATPPIALVEVQGYTYAALVAHAWLAARRGDATRAKAWRRRAGALRAAIERRFWMPEDNFYAIAVDGTDRPCRVRASNPGHLLFTRVPSTRRAEPVIRQLLSSAFDTGWGVRTLARDQPRFNPMSYHNGSVWPHDTAMCAAGMAAYGRREAAAHLLTETFDAALHFGLRLPELYCGFARGNGEPPVAYPVACLPQAWASGAAFMLLQSCLGVTIDGINRVVQFDRPQLPAQIDSLIVRRLEVGDERLDIAVERVGSRVTAAPIGPSPRAARVITRA